MQVLPTATICRDSVAQQHHPLSWSDTVSPHCKQTTRQEEDIYNFTMYSLHCIDQIVFIKLYSFYCIHQISFRGGGETFSRLQIVDNIDIGQCAIACLLLYRVWNFILFDCQKLWSNLETNSRLFIIGKTFIAFILPNIHFYSQRFYSNPNIFHTILDFKIAQFYSSDLTSFALVVMKILGA